MTQGVGTGATAGAARGSHPPRLTAAFWAIVGALTAIMLAEHLWVGGAGYDSSLTGGAYIGLYAVPGVACLVRAWQVPRERLVWGALGAGILCQAAATVLYVFVYTDPAGPPFPSVADALYLGFYPLGALALTALVRARRPRRTIAPLLDGMIVAAAVGAVVSTLVLEPVLGVASGDTLTVGVSLAYPLADLLLLSAAAGVLAASGWRLDRTTGLLVSGFAVLVVGDSLYVYGSAHGTWESGTIVDGAWPLAWALVALAAWAPRRPARPARHSTWAALATPALAGTLIVGLQIIDVLRHVGPTAEGLSLAALMLVVIRLGGAFRDLAGLADSHRQARTDPSPGCSTGAACWSAGSTSSTAQPGTGTRWPPSCSTSTTSSG